MTEDSETREKRGEYMGVLGESVDCYQQTNCYDYL